MGMQVSEDKLEAGSLPCWDPTDLVQCPVAIQDVLDPNTIEITSQKKVYVIVILCSDVVYCTVTSV